MTPTEIIERWKKTGGAEIANEQSFANELCDLLELPRPDLTVPDESANVYTFSESGQQLSLKGLSMSLTQDSAKRL